MDADKYLGGHGDIGYYYLLTTGKPQNAYP
jgi:hypothetical protein